MWIKSRDEKRYGWMKMGDALWMVGWVSIDMD